MKRVEAIQEDRKYKQNSKALGNLAQSQKESRLKGIKKKEKRDLRIYQEDLKDLLLKLLITWRKRY